MTDTTLPICNTSQPGHWPFYLRVNHCLRQQNGAIVTIVAVDGNAVDLEEAGAITRHWTHPQGAAELSTHIAHGPVKASRFEDVVIYDGWTYSLAKDPVTTPCAEGQHNRGRCISTRSGGFWNTDDTEHQWALPPHPFAQPITLEEALRKKREGQ